MKYIKRFEGKIDEENIHIMHEDLKDVFIDVIQDDNFIIDSRVNFFDDTITFTIIKRKNTYFKLTQEIIDCIIRSNDFAKEKDYVVKFEYNSDGVWCEFRVDGDKLVKVVSFFMRNKLLDIELNKNWPELLTLRLKYK